MSLASLNLAADVDWMRLALQEARLCLRAKPLPADVPVGAICVGSDGAIVGRAATSASCCKTRPRTPETLALRRAARTLGTSHLLDVTLYVTLEPCAMCAGALWLARARRVVFGAFDLKAGACGSVFDVARDPRLNHTLQVRGGVLETECSQMLSEFFAARRA